MGYNKFEVLNINGTLYAPTENSTPVYNLVHNLCVKTGTACRESPGKYVFHQKLGYADYTEVKDFKIDLEKVLDVLNENGYNAVQVNTSTYPEIEVIFL